jgi:hypothetical protein
MKSVSTALSVPKIAGFVNGQYAQKKEGDFRQDDE